MWKHCLGYRMDVFMCVSLFICFALGAEQCRIHQHTSSETAAQLPIYSPFSYFLSVIQRKKKPLCFRIPVVWQRKSPVCNIFVMSPSGACNAKPAHRYPTCTWFTMSKCIFHIPPLLEKRLLYIFTFPWLVFPQMAFIIVAGICACLYFLFLCFMVFQVFRNISGKRTSLPAMSKARRLHYEVCVVSSLISHTN